MHGVRRTTRQSRTHDAHWQGSPGHGEVDLNVQIMAVAKRGVVSVVVVGGVRQVLEGGGLPGTASTSRPQLSRTRGRRQLPDNVGHANTRWLQRAYRKDEGVLVWVVLIVADPLHDEDQLG